MMLFNRDSAIQKCFPEDSAQFASQKIRFPASRPDDVSYRLDAQLSKESAVQTTCHTVWTHIRLKHHPSGRPGFPSGPFSVSRSFELLKLASIWTIQLLVWTTLSRTTFRISFQNTDMGRSLQPSGRDGFPFGRQSARSGRACIKYGNCVHQNNRLDDHPLSLDA
jgi:hypothetical protein